MTQRFGPEQQARFRKLLTLAAESPFAGERAAALAAAERLAERHGLSLEDAARRAHDRGTAWEHQPRTGNGADSQPPPEWRRRAYAGYAYEAAASRARQQHRDQVGREQRREEERRREERAWRRSWSRRSRRRMAPEDFARLLILETRLCLREIAEITGLSEHDLVGLKLKLRPLHRAAAS